MPLQLVLKIQIDSGISHYVNRTQNYCTSYTRRFYGADITCFRCWTTRSEMRTQDKKTIYCNCKINASSNLIQFLRLPSTVSCDDRRGWNNWICIDITTVLRKKLFLSQICSEDILYMLVCHEFLMFICIFLYFFLRFWSITHKNITSRAVWINNSVFYLEKVSVL